MLTHFDHITIAARIERALDDYQRLLGRHPSWRGEYPDVGLAERTSRSRTASSSDSRRSGRREAEGCGSGWLRAARASVDRAAHGRRGRAPR